MLNVFIVDDEMPARAELRYLLEQFSDLEVIGEASSGTEALELIPEAKPDLVFLDIHLHDRDGVEVAEQLVNQMEKRPVIVFATAYEAHAVRAFELEATDYIVKPFSEQRLDKTIQRVRKRFENAHYEAGENDSAPDSIQVDVTAESHQQVSADDSLATGASLDPKQMEQQLASLIQHVLSQEQQPKRIPVEKNGKILLIDPSEIVFATVEGRYASIFTHKEQYATSFTLQELESRLPARQFFRTHRAFIVNLAKTAELVPWFKGSIHLVMQDARQSEVPVSRNAVKEVKRRLGF
ncbi:LytR/AlgR family response regulator transcription factor [Brevibacillus dissolubilis]|uniref:LytR/AlgR family response regulator transcription factor n=1 Tax=Brevibacillus dissolubilis TaxID=1844116 RepID=UPI00111698BB|nr:LytTR family DNA-binding domain-containing protein [Brevibacillus dissolubilis]